jgi:hypothetical protein
MPQKGSPPVRRRFRGNAPAILGSVVALMLGAAVMAPAADASSGPVVTGGGCAVEFGTYFISCQVDWTGGTGPFSVTWTAEYDSSISGGGSTSKYYSDAQGECYGSFEVKATVTDATGLSDYAYMGGTCGVNY